MTEPKLKIIEAEPRFYPQVCQLRDEVLRAPIGQKLTETDKKNDALCSIFILLQNDQTVRGCVMLHPISAVEIKLKQMAVHPSYQGHQWGRRLIEHAEKYCKLQGYKKIFIHARVSVSEFYSRLGYKKTGEFFNEITLDHIKMEKEI